MKYKELKEENEFLNNKIVKLQGKIALLNNEIDNLKKELNEKPFVLRRIEKIGEMEVINEIETCNSNLKIGDDLKCFIGLTDE